MLASLFVTALLTETHFLLAAILSILTIYLDQFYNFLNWPVAHNNSGRTAGWAFSLNFGAAVRTSQMPVYALKLQVIQISSHSIPYFHFYMVFELKFSINFEIDLQRINYL